jgi:hypothetical protein
MRRLLDDLLNRFWPGNEEETAEDSHDDLPGRAGDVLMTADLSGEPPRIPGLQQVQRQFARTSRRALPPKLRVHRVDAAHACRRRPGESRMDLGRGSRRLHDHQSQPERLAIRGPIRRRRLIIGARHRISVRALSDQC